MGEANLKDMMSNTMCYTEFGFRISNKKFALKIPKFKIRTPKMFMRRKYRNIPASKQEEDPDLHLKELNMHYNEFLTVTRESRRLSSDSSHTFKSFTSSSTSSGADMSVARIDDFHGATDDASSKIAIQKHHINQISYSSPSSINFVEMCSTPVSFSLEEYQVDEREVVLKNVSGVKIYEDIEESPVFESFLEETRSTVYEEVNSSLLEPSDREEDLNRTYENIDALSSIIL